ncbi:MAG TPA: 50S ribosomal protein L22 [Anaerolinea thermolimosa]|uniref:Large ribosomal subunit protein uL22 n=1 Tax=Anaerolinea thermolimosa TaxID=229919 RepID=A0A3D1JHD7_9CHLR|nr:50S ribosomal protein L22 [Anaerolinea thermolimosa]GAP05782.1 LSU ribosomal protein L22P [Anaerolinea thermolimosa]HCE17657.1 50S ribosomal protein L22 [Anaerolinea thermolimosa]
MATDIRAQLRYADISAQKARLVVDLVRGKSAVEAANTLKFMPKKAARIIERVLNSAIANAEENFGVSRDDLYVHTIIADEGPTRKWRRFGARGRFKPLLRRSSHITIVLRENE